MYAQNERKCHFLKKLGLLLLLFALLTTAASAAAVARGREYSAVEAGSVVGYEEGRRLAEHPVKNMGELFNKVSNLVWGGFNTGTDIMGSGDETTLSHGTYKCENDGEDPPKMLCASPKGEAAGDSVMISTDNLYGTIKCETDNASYCTLDGENVRGGMSVRDRDSDKKIDSGKLTIRAIRFKNGKTGSGAGIRVSDGAKVDIALCIFQKCVAMAQWGGGGIWVGAGTVNIYATTFKENDTLHANKGDDIKNYGTGTVTVHDTCPSPYSAKTPTQGKFENSIPSQHDIISCRNVQYRSNMN